MRPSVGEPGGNRIGLPSLRQMQTKRERVGRVKAAHAASTASGPLTRPSAPEKIFGRSDAASATLLLTTDGNGYLCARSWCNVQDVIRNVFSVGAYADYAPPGGQTELESAIPEHVSESKAAI